MQKYFILLAVSCASSIFLNSLLFVVVVVGLLILLIPRLPLSKPPAPTPSGNLVSNNFRRLNMKVKRFSRAPGTSTASVKRRRRAWKNERRCSDRKESKNTCYACGEEGHWVSQCPQRAPKVKEVPAVQRKVDSCRKFGADSESISSSGGFAQAVLENVIDPDVEEWLDEQECTAVLRRQVQRAEDGCVDSSKVMRPLYEADDESSTEGKLFF